MSGSKSPLLSSAFFINLRNAIHLYEKLLHADGHTDLQTDETLLSEDTIEAKREAYRCSWDFYRFEHGKEMPTHYSTASFNVPNYVFAIAVKFIKAMDGELGSDY